MKNLKLQDRVLGTVLVAAMGVISFDTWAQLDEGHTSEGSAASNSPTSRHEPDTEAQVMSRVASLRDKYVKVAELERSHEASAASKKVAIESEIKELSDELKSLVPKGSSNSALLLKMIDELESQKSLTRSRLLLKQMQSEVTAEVSRQKSNLTAHEARNSSDRIEREAYQRELEKGLFMIETLQEGMKNHENAIKKQELYLQRIELMIRLGLGKK